MAYTFSVAMCTFNGALYLREQLDSIAAQTRLPDELVVCDDSSSDETVNLVKQFAAGAPFPVRLSVNEHNIGSTRNFEKAIGFCEGDLIALADQDDVWMPEKLGRMEQEFARSQRVGLVFTDAEVVDEQARPVGYRLWQSINFGPESQKAFSSGRAFESLLAQNVVTGAAMAFRATYKDLILPLYAAVFSRYGMEDWKLIHDGWIALMIAATAEVVPVAEPLIYYRQHSGQQLGINAPWVAELKEQGWRERANEQYKEYFERELQLLGVMRDRLTALEGAYDCRATLAELNARIRHLSARLDLPDNRFARIPRVLKELLMGRYSRYSNGILSAVRDLFSGNR